MLFDLYFTEAVMFFAIVVLSIRFGHFWIGQFNNGESCLNRQFRHQYAKMKDELRRNGDDHYCFFHRRSITL